LDLCHDLDPSARPVCTDSNCASRRVRLPPSAAELETDASAWVARTGTALTSTEPATPFNDLAPFGAMIGSAHVVALGEATYGTREFFQLKHRIVRYLVSEKGFTHFAVEATAPEAADLNRYLQTGEDNPKMLLSRLYSWIWNTQEVLDMIASMREWNSTAPSPFTTQRWCSSSKHSPRRPGTRPQLS
jgi:erythromycin esterase